MTDELLIEEIRNFAETTNRAISTVAGSQRHVDVYRAANSVSVRTSAQEGVLLVADEKPVMRLSLEFTCQWSSDQRFMAIQRSSVRVLPVTREDLEEHGIPFNMPPVNEPIVRFDYERAAQYVPSSHINVHSHHPELEWMMTQGHPKSRTLKNAPRTEVLHFPTGGHRFRPCLEDILEALANDFKLDMAPGGREVLREQREVFRERQLMATVSDDTETAAEALRQLGYNVSFKAQKEPPAKRRKRLRAL